MVVMVVTATCRWGCRCCSWGCCHWTRRRWGHHSWSRWQRRGKWQRCGRCLVMMMCDWRKGRRQLSQGVRSGRGSCLRRSSNTRRLRRRRRGKRRRRRKYIVLIRRRQFVMLKIFPTWFFWWQLGGITFICYEISFRNINWKRNFRITIHGALGTSAT